MLVTFEVYADSIWGSDVLTFEDEKNAYKAAKKWKEDAPDLRILIVKKTEELIDEL